SAPRFPSPQAVLVCSSRFLSAQLLLKRRVQVIAEAANDLQIPAIVLAIAHEKINYRGFLVLWFFGVATIGNEASVNPSAARLLRIRGSHSVRTSLSRSDA